MSVERYRTIVEAELERQKSALPIEVVLAHIKHESAGVPGIVSPVGAAGLLQVMPSWLNTWNKAHSAAAITAADLRSTAPDGIRKQIAIGIFALGVYWRKVYKWLLDNQGTAAIDDLIHWSAAFYVAGPGNALKLAKAVGSVLWSDVRAARPNSKMVVYADEVWSTANEQKPAWSLARLDAWLSAGGNVPAALAKVVPAISPMIGLLLALGLIAIASYMLFKKGKGEA
jgi:hypothetical protein